MKPKRKHGRDLRGASKIAVEATTRVTDIVQEMHGNIGGFPARILSAPVYATIRGIAKLVGVSLDVALDKLGPLLGESVPSSEREAVIAALNGVVGDWLHETKNPLAIEMRLHRHGEARKKLIVLVHGSSMNDRQWHREEARASGAPRCHDHGAALARDLDATAVYVHYNSGRPVDDSGRELAALLDDLVSTWPVAIESITIVGHSMGGLVARSALAHGGAWLQKVDALVTLGTPHHGAPLERIGHIVQELGGFTKYSAPIAKLGNVRSAGVRDLRHGLKTALPEGVACFAMAGGKDRMVPKKSAFGDFPAANVAVAEGIGHLELLDAGVYPQILEWLKAPRAAPDRPSEARSASPRRAPRTSVS